LRAAITASGKSLGQIARESSIDVATICRFIHDKGGLSMAGLDQIAECLGVSLNTSRKDK
jgi:DNA-binding CsgD family transcriptional regulator